jgi:hypothetical protein
MPTGPLREVVQHLSDWQTLAGFWRIAESEPTDRSPNHPAATAAAETGGTTWAFQKPQFQGNPQSVLPDSAATPGARRHSNVR